MIDDPRAQDNRDYDYSRHSLQERSEYPFIVEWVPEGSRVVDLGCGNGSLLALLEETKKTRGFGIEISESGIEQCRLKGLDVRQGRIDQPLDDVEDDAFDVAISNVTLMMVMYPEVLLREMRRIAPVQILSFCNFAFILNRFDYLLFGRMPRPMLYNYTWYSTGHIHQLSLADFYETCSDLGLRVEASVVTMNRRPLVRWICRRWPNLLSAVPIVKLRRA